jgi:hypothetical protein
MSMSSSDNDKEEDSGDIPQPVETVHNHRDESLEHHQQEQCYPSMRTKNQRAQQARKRRKKERDGQESELKTVKKLMKRRDPSTLTNKQRKLVHQYKQSLLQTRNEKKPAKSQVVIEVLDDDDDENSTPTKEENKKDVEQNDDITDDYKDLYEEMDGHSLALPPSKRKRSESPTIPHATTENAQVVPPPEQEPENNMSTQEDVMKSLVHAKQELQRAQKLTTADRKQVIQETRARLKEAQLRVQALRQQQQQQQQQQQPVSTNPAKLPPISALQQMDNLIITNISGPDELVRFHAKDDSTNDFDAIRLQASEMAASTSAAVLDESNAQQKAKRLQFLKDKLSKLKSKQQSQSKKTGVVKDGDGKDQKDDNGKAANDSDGSLFDDEPQQESDEATVPTATTTTTGVIVKQSKEHLMKRQEELQAQMDIAYWNKLVAKQKKLLEEQQHKVQEIQVELQECEQNIEKETKGLQECDKAIAKWPILESMIVTATRQVLDTRMALRNARNDEQTNVAE